MASSKHVAWAAVNRRLVRFSTTVGEQTGYVIGQDDFHWVIATIPPTGNSFATALVHKGQTAIVTITDQVLEEFESDQIASAITMAGSPFWAHCRKVYPNI